MKPGSLSLRLGLSVVLMGAVLVLLLALLAYFALTHELSSLAKSSLQGKFEQIEHRLAEDAIKTADLGQEPHSLLDLVLGHDNLKLAIYSLDGSLLLASSRAERPDRQWLPIGDQHYRERLDTSGHNNLIVEKKVRLSDGQQVVIQLAIDRTLDEALLSAYLRTTLSALPILLLLIGAGAWWIVQRGLLPLQQFRTIVSRVTTHDLTHRIADDRLPQELKELAHGINVMLHRLDDGVRQLSQFSDDLAHELRSPITNLMGKAQVTLSRERDSEAYKSALESCAEELERLNRIVSDMLFLAQVSQPQSLVAFERVSLEDEVQRVVDLFSISAEERQISISCTGSGTALGDRLMIQRALSNLLSNAIRHSPPGSTVSLSIDKRIDTISLSVRNAGTGIPAEHLPHLFERFYRVDSARSRAEGGTGLGLSIVQSIMTLHHGSVEATSTPGDSTVFRLVFPR
ncbi:heavy metal sensor histidine kinase [Pseudomonas sp. LRF_L74]|uniref:heavy metal sensor histidine kinase n=1 Tax=Pseudomonas sp. LRF_L74 TaxID=3369422 RepID=UPI003F62B8DF